MGHKPLFCAEVKVSVFVQPKRPSLLALYPVHLHYNTPTLKYPSLKIQVFSLINCKGAIILCFWYKKKEKASWSSRYNPGEVFTFSLSVLQLIFTSRFTAFFFSITGFREERIKEMKAEHNTLHMFASHFFLFSLIHSHISQSTCAR